MILATLEIFQICYDAHVDLKERCEHVYVKKLHLN